MMPDICKGKKQEYISLDMDAERANEGEILKNCSKSWLESERRKCHLLLEIQRIYMYGTKTMDYKEGLHHAGLAGIAWIAIAKQQWSHAALGPVCLSGHVIVSSLYHCFGSAHLLRKRLFIGRWMYLFGTFRCHIQSIVISGPRQ